jgi:hypothetical protein
MAITAKAIVDPASGKFLVGNPGGGALRKGAGDMTNNYETKKQRSMIRDMMDTKFDAQIEILKDDGTIEKTTWLSVLGDMLVQMSVMGQAKYPKIRLENGEIVPGRAIVSRDDDWFKNALRFWRQWQPPEVTVKHEDTVFISFDLGVPNRTYQQLMDEADEKSSLNIIDISSPPKYLEDNGGSKS